MQTPKIRDIALSGGQFITGVIAAVAFMSSKSVDLYAAWHQLYEGFKLILGAWAIAGPILIGAVTVYLGSTKQKLQDIVKDPTSPATAGALPVTPGSVAVANALKEKP